MSSLRSNFSLDSKSRFDELKWVIQIKRTLEEELEENDEYLVSIFNVPKLLMASDPHSYIPQQVSIGPYHCWNQELYEMQRYKLESAKRFQKTLCIKFDTIVDQLIKLLLEQKIRACYHKFLDFNGENLVWIVAVDASFLLEFLQIYAIKEGTIKVNSGVSSNMSHFVDYYDRKKSAHNAILRDIVMLENQIPLFVLRKMLEFKFSSSLEDAENMLVLMLIGLFKEISPFKMMMMEKEYPKNVQVSKISACAHILDFLYDMIVPKLEQQQQQQQKPEIIEDDIEECQQEEDEEKENEKSRWDPRNVEKLFSELWTMLSKLNKGPGNLIKKVLFSRPFKFIVKLPWTIIFNLPGVRVLKQPIEYFFFSSQNNEEEEENRNSASSSKSNNSTIMSKPPLVEEITIPSVSQLLNCGVYFIPTNGSISSIKFDTKTCTLYLPKISLDVNTEVFLRNLVAYEASIGKGPLVITRYTELMNGIIDSEDDVKILREKGIVMNHMKSDEEVVILWNGMNKSLRLSKVQFLDKVIEDVNKYYNGTMKVKIWKLMKVYVFSSWQFLTFLATIFLLLLMTLQAFCSVYTCRNFGDSLTSD